MFCFSSFFWKKAYLCGCYVRFLRIFLTKWLFSLIFVGLYYHIVNKNCDFNHYLGFELNFLNKNESFNIFFIKIL